MSLEIFIKYRGQNLDRTIDKLAGALSPTGLALWMESVLTPYLQQRARDRFRSEGDDAVGKWAPLSPATVSIRENAGYSGEHPINHRSGQLERYITSGAVMRVTLFPGGALMTYPGNEPTGELGRKLQTAQEGKGQPYTPARPVLGISSKDISFAITALDEYITSAGRG